MNYDQNISREKKRKRIAVGILFLVYLLYGFPDPSETSILEFATAQMLPLFTYEKEYGTCCAEYDSGYEVPDRFYEDEMEQPVNDNLAVAEKQKEAEQPPVNETIGTTFQRSTLCQPDFLLNKIFVVDSNTSLSTEEMSADNLLDTDVSIENIKESGEDKILIYHTHGSESFADSREGVKEDTIIGVGAHLEKILEEEYGIATYHDETLYDVIDGKLDRNRAYEMAYNNVSGILKENPSIQVVIDLHRDGVDEDVRLVTDIDGKQTAKIMFLNGVSRSNMNGEIAYLKNPYRNMNLAFSFQMYLQGKALYGDYVRKIYVKSLRFNMHLMPRTTLIEVGAQNNTVEEEKNAMEPLAAILDKVLSKKKSCDTIISD